MAHCNYNGPIGSQPYPRDVTSPGADQRPGTTGPTESHPQVSVLQDPQASMCMDTLLALVQATADAIRAGSPAQALNYLANADRILAPICKISHDPTIYALDARGSRCPRCLNLIV
jgi:hypothetical protein